MSRLWLWVLSVPYLSYWSKKYQINCHFTKLEVIVGKRWSGFPFHGPFGGCFPVTSGILNLRKFCFLGCLVYGCENVGSCQEHTWVLKQRVGSCAWLTWVSLQHDWVLLCNRLLPSFLSKSKFLGPTGPNNLGCPNKKYRYFPLSPQLLTSFYLPTSAPAPHPQYTEWIQPC